MHNQIFKLIALTLIIMLAGCSGRLFTVHKIDVQQGNAVDPEKVAQLEIGMTKEQVEFLMGTPLIADPFHPERWDYIFFLIPDYGPTQQRHLVVYFDNDRVSVIDNQSVPEPTPEVLAEEQATQEKLITNENDELKELDAEEDVPDYVKEIEEIEQIEEVGPDI